MAKNILIFSDGTGQRSGVFFDENRSNVYKLYRATRCASDSTIDPHDQLAFYDPGIGTDPVGSNIFSRTWTRVRNLVAVATGLGLTKNIINCYAAIVRLWQPGDRIFLFGFSRGAYTVRCLSGVLAYCGVPTAAGDSSGQMKRDPVTAGRIAKEAVKRVYQHTSSRVPKDATPRQRELLEQRKELARQFRAKYGCEGNDGDDSANVAPHFIGVFDTVASLANPFALWVFGIAAVIALLVAGVLVSVLWTHSLGWTVICVFAVAALASGAAYIATHLRAPGSIKGYPWWRTLHFAEARVHFYDTNLSPKVTYARHAVSIDERRKSFPRVPWGRPSSLRERTAGAPEWFEQVWFAGNHSDVGGGYADNEARLSDISLQWMLEAAIGAGLKHDPTVLRAHPDPTGIQHDEMRSSLFKYFGELVRRLPDDAPLHPSVLQRLLADNVLQWDVSAPYRPGNLREHDQAKQYY